MIKNESAFSWKFGRNRVTSIINGVSTTSEGPFTSVRGGWDSLLEVLVSLGGVSIVHADGTSTPVPASSTVLETARDSAVSGDTVVVGPGTYAITSNLAKNGVDWFGFPGALISRTDSADGFIFSVGSGISFDVGGYFTFLRNIPSDVAVTLLGTGVLEMKTGAGTVNFEFIKAEAKITAATAVNTLGGATFALHGGILNARGQILTNTDAMNGSYTIWWEDGISNIQINQLLSYVDGVEAGQCCTSVILAAATGHLRIDAQEIYADGEGACINTKAASGTPTVAVWITAKTIIGGFQSSSGKSYISAQKMIGPISVNASGSSPPVVYLNILKQGNALISAAPYLDITGGTVYANITQFDPSTNVQELVYVHPSSTTAAVCFLTSQDIKANASQNALRSSGVNGVLNVLSGRITSDAGKLDLLRSTGTLNVSPAVNFSTAKTSGTITPFTGVWNDPIVSGALPTVSPSTGTAFQCSTTRDTHLVVPVTFNPTGIATATVQVQVSADNSTFSTTVTKTYPALATLAGSIDEVSCKVPAGWYVKLTATNATLGTGTYY